MHGKWIILALLSLVTMGLGSLMLLRGKKRYMK